LGPIRSALCLTRLEPRGGHRHCPNAAIADNRSAPVFTTSLICVAKYQIQRAFSLIIGDNEPN